MYLLEGAGELHRAFEMIVGDVMVFAQKPDGTLIMAGRPATKVCPGGGQEEERWQTIGPLVVLLLSRASVANLCTCDLAARAPLLRFLQNDVIKKAPIKRASSKAEGGGPGKRDPKPKRNAGEGGRGAGGAKKRSKPSECGSGELA